MLKHREALAEAGEEHLYGWFDEELQLARYKICEDSPMIGQTLTQLAFRELMAATSCRFQLLKKSSICPAVITFCKRILLC